MSSYFEPAGPFLAGRRDKQRSLSAKNLYDSLPRGLKQELQVKTRVEDPDVQRERAQLVQSKSVSELSQVTSLSDIPVPKTLEKIVTRVRSSDRSAEASERGPSAAGLASL